MVLLHTVITSELATLGDRLKERAVMADVLKFKIQSTRVKMRANFALSLVQSMFSSLSAARISLVMVNFDDGTNLLFLNTA